MPETTNPATGVDETPAPVTTREDAEKIERLRDDPRNSIYEKYDAIKAAREEAEAEPTPEAPETPPKEEASVPEVKPEAEPAVEEPEVLSFEEAKEKLKKYRIKGKFAGEEAVVDIPELIKVQGLTRHLTKATQELAREREALLHKAAGIQPSTVQGEPPIPADESEIEQRYNELVSESPYRANQYLESVKAERVRKQAEIEKARMDMAEKNFLVRHPELEPSDYEELKGSFSNPDFFRNNPHVDDAFQRRDYTGALELARVVIKEQKLNEKLVAIEDARKAILAEEQKRTDLKKKGSVIRTASKPEPKPKEEFKVLTPIEVVREEAARRRRLQGR